MKNRRERKEEYRSKRDLPRKKDSFGSRGLAILTFIMLFIYLAGYLIDFYNRPSIRVESVELGTISTPSKVKGIIIRDETVIRSDRSGTPIYKFADNQRVPKNQVACVIQNSNNVDKIEKEIKSIDRQLIEIQRNRSDISIFSEDIKNIEDEIESIVDEYSYKFISGGVSEVYSMRESIMSQIDTRTNIWIAENTSSLASLQEERKTYSKNLDENTSSIVTQTSGIISYRIDGFEEVFTPETMGSIDKKNFEMKYDTTYVKRAEKVAEETPIFKTVNSNTWYIASYIPREEADTFEVGDEKKLFTSVKEEDKIILAEVLSKTDAGEEVYVVFKTTKDIIDFISERVLSFRINEGSYEGFKIPNEAVVERPFIKVPVQCLTERLGEVGVIKQVGEEDIFISLSVTSYDEEFAYVLENGSQISLGDTLLMGTGGINEVFTLKDAVTLQGVYVGNTSIARFKLVDVIGQNADYTIVSSDSVFGLRIYDKIVSDAKSIEEFQALY